MTRSDVYEVGSLRRGWKRYTTQDGHLVTRWHRTRKHALRAAETLPGLVRIATPAGALIKYVDNRGQR